MYPEKKGGSHKMARPQQNWGLLTLLTRWASIWTMPNTASPKSEPPCGRAVYQNVVCQNGGRFVQGEMSEIIKAWGRIYLSVNFIIISSGDGLSPITWPLQKILLNQSCLTPFWLGQGWVQSYKLSYVSLYQIQSVLLEHGLLWCDTAHNIGISKGEFRSDSEPTKDNPYFIFTGKIVSTVHILEKSSGI